MRLVDTNVLIYAASPSAEDAEKRRRAQVLLREGGLAVSVQVLQEFYWQVTRASRARACGCDAAYSEDLSDRQDYEGLRVINPFREHGRQR